MKKLLLIPLLILAISCSRESERILERQKVVEEFGGEVYKLTQITSDDMYLVRCPDGSVWMVQSKYNSWNDTSSKLIGKTQIFPETVPAPPPISEKE